MIKKGMFVLIAFALMATPAFADTRPEFDAVGCDTENIFAQGFVEDMVVAHAIYDPFAVDPIYINEWSDFPDEEYWTDASQERTDPCFGLCDSPAEGYQSNLASAGTYRSFKWKIVLQMQPESDINLDIRDCVMTFQGLDIWKNAYQTGRFRGADAKRLHVCFAQPRLTVKAAPGINAHPGWADSWCGWHCSPTLKARRLPGGLFRLVDLDEVPYTSKGLWQESILIAVPDDGSRDKYQYPMYRLREGDIIMVLIDVPSESPVDVRYGEDNVLLRYVGVVGTEYIDDEQCDVVSLVQCGTGK